VDDQAFETVLDVVRGSAPTIIVDVPHTWCSWSKRLLTSADEIVITATPDLAAFRNTKQLVDILSASRPNDAPPKLVINQFDPKTSAVQPAQFIEHVGVKPAQVFTWEPQLFVAAATNAAPIVEISPRSKTTQAIRELSALLIGRSEASLAKSKFRISDLFKKKR
jgi:pilus assembly protein CpaE